MSYHYPPYGTFSGAETSVAEPPAPDLVPPFTVSIWFRTTFDYFNNGNGFGYMIHKGSFLSGTINFALIVSSDLDPPNHAVEIFFSQGPSDAWAAAAGTGLGNGPFVNVLDGQWHNLTGTYNGTNELKVYLDAFLDFTENPGSAVPPTNNSNMIIGGGGSVDFIGDLDEIRIWNVVLNQSEITNYVNNGVVPQQANIVYENNFGGSGSGATSSGLVTNSTIQVYHSGGSANADPMLDKGGLKSSVQINYSKIDNIFKSTDAQQDQDGLHDVRGLYVVNSHETQTLRGVKVFIFKDTTSVEDQILVGKCAENKNETIEALALVTDTPAGVTFSGARSAANGILLGDLLPGEFIGIWLKRDVNEGTNAFPNNLGQLGLYFTAEQVENPDEGGGEGGGETGHAMTIAAAGDMSCSSTFANMLDDRIDPRNVDLFLSLGDNAYSSGSMCWIELIEDAGLGGAKSIITFGNHDSDEDEDQPETAENLLTAFSLPAMYYERVYNNCYFLVLDSENNPEDNPQFTTQRNRLIAAASNPAIDWIFVLHHRPIYGPDSNHPNETDVRDLWDPIFDANKVDFVLTGHNHLIFASDLIRYDPGTPVSPIVVSTGSGTPRRYSYSKSSVNHGKIYMGIGNGGRSHYGADDNPSYLRFLNDTTYGYTLFTQSDDGKIMNVKQLSTSDSILNQFEVEHL